MKAQSKAFLPAIAVIAILAAPLGGCASKPGGGGILAHACQTRSCTCEAQEAEPFRRRATTEVLWRVNGDAYCPEGFVLKSTDAN